MNWQNLVQPKYADDAFIHGNYFVIKYTPDTVAGQVFNLGVAFIPHDSQTIHYRLLDQSLKGFAYIYGEQATEGLRLLLQILSYALDDSGHFSAPSPQIHYTPLQPIKGLSLNNIMDNLYQDFIHMDSYPQKKAKKHHILNTKTLREQLFDTLKQHNKQQYYHKEKISLENDLQEGKIYLDLPIWKQENSLFKNYQLLASVVSADYIETEALSYNLDFLGCNSVQNACTILGKEHTKAGIFIYRPTLNERITPEILNNIDNHIDNSLYQLQRMHKKEKYDINIGVLDDEMALFEKIAEFTE